MITWTILIIAKIHRPSDKACTAVFIRMQKLSSQFRFDCECLPGMLTASVGRTHAIIPNFIERLYCLLVIASLMLCLLFFVWCALSIICSSYYVMYAYYYIIGKRHCILCFNHYIGCSWYYVMYTFCYIIGNVI